MDSIPSPPAFSKFPASFDTTTKVLSAVVCLLLAVLAIAIDMLWIGVIGVVIVVASYAWSPRRYRIEERTVVVERLIGEARIPLEGIRSLRRATKQDFRGCLRLWGSGGMFGYYGLFRTSTLGKSTWYMTNRANAVVLITAAQTVLFSPDDVDSFIATIGAPVAVPPSDGIASAPEPLFGRWRFVAIAGGLMLAVAFAGFAWWTITWSPGPPKHTLTATELTIHDPFYSVTITPDKADVDAIRVVDLRTEQQWRPVARTNGFANSHYRSGWFRVSNGSTVKLFNAGGRRLVLIPAAAGGVTVLVEASQPEQFVEELRRAWRH